MNPRERFLREMDDEIRGQKIEGELRRPLLEELASHLDASLQARLETGEPLEEAERRAVEALGSPREIVRRLAQVHAPRRQTRLDPLCTVAALVAAITLAVDMCNPPEPLRTLLLLALLPELCLFMIFSWRARRFQAYSLLALLLPCSLAFTIAFSTDWTTIGPDFRLSRSSLPESVAFLANSVTNLERQEAAFDAAYALFQRTGGLRTPRSFDSATGQLVFRNARSEELARRSWALINGDRSERLATLAQEKEKAENARAALNGSIWREVPNEMGFGSLMALTFLGIWFAANLLVTILRSGLDRLRRRPRRGTTA